MVGTCAIPSSDPISVSSSNEHFHLCLLALAEKGNRTAPIAARLQSQPTRIDALLGSTDPTSLTAAGWIVFKRRRFPRSSIAFDMTVRLSKLHQNMTAIRPFCYLRLPGNTDHLELAPGPASAGFLFFLRGRVSHCITVGAARFSSAGVQPDLRFGTSSPRFLRFQKRMARSASARTTVSSMCFNAKPLSKWTTSSSSRR